MGWKDRPIIWVYVFHIPGTMWTPEHYRDQPLSTELCVDTYLACGIDFQEYKTPKISCKKSAGPKLACLTCFPVNHES